MLRTHSPDWNRTRKHPPHLDGGRAFTFQEAVSFLEGAQQADCLGHGCFLSALYQQPTRISTLLRRAGLSGSEIECLRQQGCLDEFALRFCPKLWQWLGDTGGTIARAVIIDLYGLNGSRGRRPDYIARRLATTTQDVVALREKALQQMRVQQKQAELEELAVTTAQAILSVSQKDAAEQGE